MKPRVYLPAVLSGLLLWTAFFPLDLGPVAAVALVPFLTLVRADGVGRWRRYTAALVGGLVFAVPAVNWVRVAHPMMMYFAWPGLALYCALYWPLALFLLRRLDRLGRPPLAVTLPAVWVGLEYMRAHFPTGFPFLSAVGAHQLIGFGWYFLGYTQHHVLPLIQAADLGGVYLISVLVAAANGAAYEWAVRSRAFRWLVRWPREHRPPTFTREVAVSGAVAALAVVTATYGFHRLTHPAFPLGPRVAAVQGNLPQNQKIIRGDQSEGQTGTPLEREYLPLAVRAARTDGKTVAPDLVIWPETCFPVDWMQVAADGQEAAVPKYEAEYAKEIPKFLAGYARTQLGTNTLLGLNSIDWAGGVRRKANSALLVRADGSVGGRYDKIHLVPFGEYVPLKEQFPWMSAFTPYKHDYSCTPGESLTRFELTAKDGRAYTFGVLICYEDSDPYLARQYNPSSGNPGVDFLVNLSNDGWFDGTEEHEQHLAICRFRAVETRRSVVRAVNMGISAVIDPDGRVVAWPADPWGGSKKLAGVVRAQVPVDDRASVYAAAGDWVPAACWGVVAVGLVVPALRRVKKQ